MKIQTIFATLALMAAAYSCADKSAVQEARHDWTEPAEPEAVDETLWAGVDGTFASFGSVNDRYRHSEPYAGAQSKSHAITGWRGEKLHAQIVLWSSEPLENLECSVGQFRSDNAALPEGTGRARFVKYVLSDNFNPEKPCGLRTPGQFGTFLSADLLDEAPMLDIEARTARPVWITVEVPRDARPGKYDAQIKLRAKGGFMETLALSLDVIDRELPPPSEWTYQLDLWQHPSSVARVENVELWSEEHFRLMDPTMKMLAGAGQKIITVNLNKDPWNVQTYDPYADMILWKKLLDGSWEYDYTVFDRWVGYMLGLGIDKYINCYSLLPWNNELHYFDEAAGKMITVSAAPQTPVFSEMWTPFLTDFVRHLRENGWLGFTNIAMDERSPEDMEIATALLAKAAPELGIALADNHFTFKKYPYIKDMCTEIFADIEVADIEARRTMSLSTTFYVCCSSDFPNTYTKSAPAEAVYLGWFAAARQYDGFLRWAYNSWTEDPIRDSRFRKWTAGDTYLVYPEGRSSIRFERLIEGIQDWEKIRALKLAFAAENTPEAAAKSASLDQAVSRFHTREPFEGWNQALDDAKEVLNELSK